VIRILMTSLEGVYRTAVTATDLATPMRANLVALVDPY
jgi:hypothetical protein